MGEDHFNSDRLDDLLKTLDQWRIDSSRLQFNGTVIDKGGSSVVRFAELSGSSPPSGSVVVRQFRIEESNRRLLALMLARQMRIWADMAHPNIIPVYGHHISQNLENICLISPVAVYGRIDKYVAETQASELEKLKLILDAAKGLKYLHDQQPLLCHGDLKAGNVVIKSDRTAALCDVGLAAVIEPLSQSSDLTPSKGVNRSARWSSPELLNGQKPSSQSDLWAFGCVIVEVLTGQLPYPTARDEGHVMALITGGASPEPSDNACIPDLLLVLLRGCWTEDPAKRPSADTLCSSINTVYSGLTAQKVLQHSSPCSVELQRGSISLTQSPTPHQSQNYQLNHSPQPGKHKSRHELSEFSGPPSGLKRTDRDSKPDLILPVRSGGVSYQTASETTIITFAKAGEVAAVSPPVLTAPTSGRRGILTSRNPKPGLVPLSFPWAGQLVRDQESSPNAERTRRPSAVSFDLHRTGPKNPTPTGAQSSPTFNPEGSPFTPRSLRDASFVPSGLPPVPQELLGGDPPFHLTADRLPNRRKRASAVGLRHRRGDGDASEEYRAELAIAEISIGGELYKYGRQLFGKVERRKRDCRVDPPSRMLYWTSGRFANLGRSSTLVLECARIDSVKVVSDLNPFPRGLYQRSIEITSGIRKLKFTAPTKERHDIWFLGLCYVLRPDTPLSKGISPEPPSIASGLFKPGLLSEESATNGKERGQLKISEEELVTSGWEDQEHWTDRSLAYSPLVLGPAPKTNTEPVEEDVDQEVIGALLHTMEGEFMEVSMRGVRLKGGRKKPARRFFWVYPYTKTLYWSTAGHGARSVKEANTKNISIGSISRPPKGGAFASTPQPLSITVSNSLDEIQLNPSSIEQCDIWYQALKYLAIRDTPIPLDFPGLNGPRGSVSKPGKGERTGSPARSFATMSRRAFRNIRSRRSLNKVKKSARIQPLLSKVRSVGRRSVEPNMEQVRTGLKLGDPAASSFPSNTATPSKDGYEDNDLEGQFTSGTPDASRQPGRRPRPQSPSPDLVTTIRPISIVRTPTIFTGGTDSIDPVPVNSPPQVISPTCLPWSIFKREDTGATHGEGAGRLSQLGRNISSLGKEKHVLSLVRADWRPPARHE